MERIGRMGDGKDGMVGEWREWGDTGKGGWGKGNNGNEKMEKWVMGRIACPCSLAQACGLLPIFCHGLGFQAFWKRMKEPFF